MKTFIMFLPFLLVSVGCKTNRSSDVKEIKSTQSDEVQTWNVSAGGDIEISEIKSTKLYSCSNTGEAEDRNYYVVVLDVRYADSIGSNKNTLIPGVKRWVITPEKRKKYQFYLPASDNNLKVLKLSKAGQHTSGFWVSSLTTDTTRKKTCDAGAVESWSFYKDQVLQSLESISYKQEMGKTERHHRFFK